MAGIREHESSPIHIILVERGNFVEQLASREGVATSSIKLKKSIVEEGGGNVGKACGKDNGMDFPPSR